MYDTKDNPAPCSTHALLEEYKEIGANLRAYANMRFAQLTLFAAISGGLISIAFGEGAPLGFLGQIIISSLGLGTTIVLWVMENRSTHYWKAYEKRAIEIENNLQLYQYKGRPKGGRISSTNAVMCLYGLASLCWAFSLIVSLLGAAAASQV